MEKWHKEDLKYDIFKMLDFDLSLDEIDEIVNIFESEYTPSIILSNVNNWFIKNYGYVITAHFFSVIEDLFNVYKQKEEQYEADKYFVW